MIKYTYNIPLHYEKIFEKQEKNINLSASQKNKIVIFRLTILLYKEDT